MIAIPVSTEVDVFSYYHFEYFINNFERLVDNRHRIYNNKVIRAGVSFADRQGTKAISFVEEEYLERGIYAFLVVDRSEEFATVWYEVYRSLSINNLEQEQEEELESCLTIEPKSFNY